MAGKEKGEAYTEKEREYCVKLAIDEGILQEANQPVGGCSRHCSLRISSEKGPQTEFGEICQCNAQ